ncbi:MAG: DUF5615 family PIN-like protein [Proteobacteria bacterium]|nr:DUF5615 family PIN-like protein [Pseudomonadota bacterium]
MKFLVDECLTVQLVDVANSRGHMAAHVAHVGLSGCLDSEIATYAFDNDYIVVTNNAAVEFDRTKIRYYRLP